MGSGGGGVGCAVTKLSAVVVAVAATALVGAASPFNGTSTLL